MLVIDFRFSATRRFNFTYQRRIYVAGANRIGHGVDMAYEKLLFIITIHG
jgi:hypothetical protein